MTGVGSRDREPVDVDVGHEYEDLIPALDRFGIERAPCDVYRLVEVVRRRARFAVTPQQIHRLLAMQPMPGREREQFH